MGGFSTEGQMQHGIRYKSMKNSFCKDLNPVEVPCSQTYSYLRSGIPQGNYSLETTQLTHGNLING